MMDYMYALNESPFSVIAREQYTANSLAYHNWEHILDGLCYLDRSTADFDHDIFLAWLFHDVVYDKESGKEKRSAEFFQKHVDSKNQTVVDLIMYTATHSVLGANRNQILMIKTDLHQLRDKRKSIHNYERIITESMGLYEISEKQFAESNLNLMDQLSKTMKLNYMETRDPFWMEVLQGIELTKNISRSVLGV